MTPNMNFSLDRSLLLCINDFQAKCLNQRSIESITADSYKKSIAYYANVVSNDLNFITNCTEIKLIAKSYGLSPTQLIRRAVLDFHFSILNVFCVDSDHLLSYSSSSALNLDEEFAQLEKPEGEEYTPLSEFTQVAFPIEELLKLNCAISLDEKPTGTLFSSSAGALIIPYDVIDFNHRSKGRFSAYSYVIFFKALQTAGISLEVPTDMFLGSSEMIEERIGHAERTYKAIRIEREEGNLSHLRTIDIEWFQAIFTSDNLSAMNDVLVDIETELWYMNFFRSEVEVDQYKQLYKDRSDIFALLASLQGHPLEEVRSRAIVLLNGFLDDHEWQLFFPLLPRNKKVGDQIVIKFTIESAVTNKDNIANEPPKGVHLQLCAPPADTKVKSNHNFLSYHRVNKWEFVGMNKADALWQGTVHLGEFTRCGFYDWRILTSDVKLGSWDVSLLPLEKDCNFADIPWLSRGKIEGAEFSTVLKLAGRCNASPIQGRYICHNKSNNGSVLEYKVDNLLGDSKNSSAGHLVDAIKSLPSLPAESKFDTICLRGAQGLRNRGPPSAFSGTLPKSLHDLARVSICQGIDVCVETGFRVSSSDYDKKYRDYLLKTKEDGRLSECFGAEGLAHDLKDSSVLNYRDIRSWNLFLEDAKEWIDQQMATGIIIEGMGSGLPLFSVDIDEMWKLDTDQMPHYSDEEKLLGKVVIPLAIENKCTGTNTWPDPFSVFVCKGIWATNPFAKIIGESAITSAADQLSRSGVIPYIRSLLPLLAATLKVQSVPDLAIVKAEFRSLGSNSTPQNLHQCINQIINGTVPGTPTIVSTLSPGAFTSFGHLEGKAWPFVSWLTLLPIRCSFGWEEKFDQSSEATGSKGSYLFPYLSKDLDTTPSLSTPIHSDAQRARSFLGSVRNGSQNPHSALAQKQSSTIMTPRGSQIGFDKSSSFLNINNLKQRASMVGKIREVVEDAKKHTAEIVPLTTEKVQSLAAVGLDTTKFDKHIDACVKRGMLLTDTLRAGMDASTPELYIPMKTASNDPNILTFARIIPNGSFTICAINFGDHPQVAVVPLNALHHLFIAFKINRHSNYIVQVLTESGPQPEDICTLLESMTMNIEFTLPPGESGIRMFSIQPHGLKLPKRELYRFAFHRLVQGAKDALKAARRNDKEWSNTVARSLNSNALIVDFINTLQQRKGLNQFAHYIHDTANVVQDLYNGNQAQGYHKFLATLLDLGVFSTHCALPIDDAIKTGTPTSLASVYAEKIAAISSVDNPPEWLKPTVDLAQVLTNSNGLGPIVLCTSEYGKYSTVGGLGVMVDELASTLVKVFKQEVWVISPYYERNAKGHHNNFSGDGVEYLQNVGVQVGPDYMEFGLHHNVHKGVRSFFIHHSDIYPCPYPDNKGEAQLRFLTFTAKAMLETICFLLGKGERMPELVISNDWPTGLLAAHAKHTFGDTFRGTTFFHIVHNLDPSYEGRVWCNKDLHYIHQLNTELLVDPSWNKPVYNPSRCALLSSDSWGTVSPSYRNELLGIGCQSSSPLQPILARCHDSFATPNGVPIEEREQIILAKMKSCNLIPQNYEVKKPTEWLELHSKAKEYLQRTYFGFEEPDHAIPMLSFIGRITSQKGVHLIAQGAEHLIKRYNYRIQFLIGGMVNWSDPYSAGCGRAMLDLRNRYPYCFWCGPDDFFYDGAIVNVGADISLMPSAFEPGGIVQHEFFSGGTPVLAFKTGGLRDTVHEFQPEKNIGNGWTFEAFNQGDFLYACERAVRIFNDKPTYDRLRMNAKQATISSTEVAGKWLAEFTRIRRKFNVPTVTKPVEKLDVQEFKQWYDEQVVEEIVIGEAASIPSSPTATSPVSPVSTRIVLPSSKIRYTPPEHAPRPRTVAVSGGWNNWMVRHPMFFDPSTGQFFVSIQGKRGSWPYKIIKDGEWILNPDEEETMLDHDGNANSVLHI